MCHLYSENSIYLLIGQGIDTSELCVKICTVFWKVSKNVVNLIINGNILRMKILDCYPTLLIEWHFPVAIKGSGRIYAYRQGSERCICLIVSAGKKNRIVVFQRLECRCHPNIFSEQVCGSFCSHQLSKCVLLFRYYVELNQISRIIPKRPNGSYLIG